MKELKGHTSHVNKVKYSPTGEYILSAGFSGELFLWEKATGERIQVYEGHNQTVNSVIWLNDGKSILSASGDGIILEHELSSAQPTQRWQDLKTGVSHMQLTYDQKFLLTSNKSSMLRVREWPEGELINKFKGEQINIGVLSVAQQSPHAIIGGMGKTLKRVMIPSGEVMEEMEAHNTATMGFHFFDDDKHAVSVGYDGNLILWDMEQHQPLEKFNLGNDGYYSIAVSNDETEVAITMPYQLKRVNLKSLSVDEKDLPAKGNYSVDYSAEDDQIALASADKLVRLVAIQ